MNIQTDNGIPTHSLIILLSTVFDAYSTKMSRDLNHWDTTRRFSRDLGAALP